MIGPPPDIRADALTTVKDIAPHATRASLDPCHRTGRAWRCMGHFRLKRTDCRVLVRVEHVPSDYFTINRITTGAVTCTAPFWSHND